MSLSDLLAVELPVAAFAGGAFGAAIGALPSFALAGLLVVLGETAAVARTGFGGFGASRRQYWNHRLRPGARPRRRTGSRGPPSRL